MGGHVASYMFVVNSSQQLRNLGEVFYRKIVTSCDSIVHSFVVQFLGLVKWNLHLRNNFGVVI